MSTVCLTATSVTLVSHRWDHAVCVHGIDMSVAIGDGTADDLLVNVMVGRGVAGNPVHEGRSWLAACMVSRGNPAAAATGFSSAMANKFTPLMEIFYVGETISLDINIEEGSVGGSDMRAIAIIHYHAIAD